MLIQWLPGNCGTDPAALPVPPSPLPGGGGGGGGLTAPPSDGRLYGMKNGQWVLVPQTLAMEYSFNETVAAPPSSGQLRMNNLNQQAATLLWVSEITAPGISAIAVLKQLGAGVGLYLQDKDDSAKWIAYNVTGPAIDKGTYIEVPVQFVAASATPLPAGQRIVMTNTTQFTAAQFD